MADWSSPEAVRQAVKAFRDMAYGQRESSISEQQAKTTKDFPVKGPQWVSKFTIPLTPEVEILDLLIRAIDYLGDGKGTYQRPSLQPLNTQWTGYRSGVSKDAPEPQISEHEKYIALANSAKSPFVIYYIYGGAFYMNGLSTNRRIYTQLAQLTGGRVFCVAQSLAPQYPFPATLYDIVVGYLSLLHPPPGSFHQPIPAKSIVIAADSSGACLALAFLQTLLTIQRQGWASSGIRFHGHSVPLQLPAGCAFVSAIADMTSSLPSYRLNAANDVFPEYPPSILPGQPTCSLWPSKPPRGNIYCELDMLTHPLVAPATTFDWSGAPPLWFACGQEQTVDSAKAIAQTAARQGVSVVFKEYEAMPHCFHIFFPTSPQARKLWKEWSQALVEISNCEGLESAAVRVKCDQELREETLGNLEQLLDLDTDDVRDVMQRTAASYWVFTGQKKGWCPKL